MQYYFPEKQEFTLDYFSAKSITRDTKHEVQVAVESWLAENGYEQTDFYLYTRKTTIDHIDVDYNGGLFYYMHLNNYLRDVASVVWCIAERRERAAGKSEKERGKIVDKAMREFVEFAKAKYPKK